MKSLSYVWLFMHPWTGSLPGFSILAIFPGKSTGVLSLLLKMHLIQLTYRTSLLSLAYLKCTKSTNISLQFGKYHLTQSLFYNSIENLMWFIECDNEWKTMLVWVQNVCVVYELLTGSCCCLPPDPASRERTVPHRANPGDRITTQNLN